jgi:Protein of unknown function (DUF5672)
MNQQCAIVIPAYRAKLDWNERISLDRAKQVFKNQYDIILVYPEGMDLSLYKSYDVFTQFIPMKAKYFSSVLMYSNLMNLSYFYQPFLTYKFILLYQLDTFVFENNLEQWCNSGYDYIGAPWIKAQWIEDLKKKFSWIGQFIYPVGNGGLSLRNVKKFYYGSIFLRPISLFWQAKWHEDFFWGSVAHRLIPGFKVPNVGTALQFAFEEHPQECYELNNHKLPFGCHAWEKFEPEFWKKHIGNYGYNFEK